MRNKIISVLFLLLVSFSLYANKRSYITAKIEDKSPKIDGLFDEPVWNQVEWGDDFIQTIPHEKAEPSQETKFKILYDENNIFVAIKCYDKALDSIDSRLGKRDDFQGDWVGLCIDSYHDLRTDFVFAVNAAGVKSDGIQSNDGSFFDLSLDPVWDVKTNVDNEGWNVEMKIPLSQLRFGNNTDHIWGFQMVRFLYRKGEESYWQFKSPKTPGWTSSFGEVHGIKDIRPKKQRDIVPYVVAKNINYKKDAENPFAPGMENKANIGLDGKVGLTNDLTLDFTINPDFGQVEADPSQMNLSTFETYFEEKRLFFIEGRNILDFPLTPGWWELSSDNAFYSRRIGRKPNYWPETEDGEYIKYPDNTTILGALKVTGKTKKGWSIGIMESLTQQEKAEIDSSGIRRFEEVEPLSNYLIGRVQKDFNNSNTQLGAIFSGTNRKITSEDLKGTMHKDAYTCGIDFNHRWKEKKYYINFNTLYSNVQGSKASILETQLNAPHFFQRNDASHLKVDSNRIALQGLSSTFKFGSSGNGKWMYETWLTFRSPGFNNNEMGFMRTSDIIQQTNWVGYRLNETKGIFRFVGLNFNQWNAYTFGGERLYTNENYNNHFTFINFWSTGGGFSRRSKSFSAWELRGGPSLLIDGGFDYFVYIGTSDKKKVQIYTEYNGDRMDHHIQKRDNIYMNLNFNLMEELQFSIGSGYMKKINELQYIGNVDYGDEQRYIRGKMVQNETNLTARINVSLSPNFTIQYYGMPFISAGKFTNMKYIVDPKAENYKDRYRSYSDNQISFNEEENTYHIDEDNDGVEDYSFDNSDFNMYDFNSNLVIRWEYKPGSLLYLVWSQNRNDRINDGNFDFSNDVHSLFSTFPQNIFLIKLSYRIGL